MFDNTNPDGDNRFRDWLLQRPKFTRWAVVAALAVTILLVLASAHRPGLQMITPGQKSPPLGQAMLDRVIAPIQASLALAHSSAATRQADAKG